MNSQLWRGLKRHALAVGKGIPAALAVLVLASLPVMAEEIEETTSNPDDAYQLESVTVTAQKMEEDAQEIPASITALDQVAIEDAKIESVRDLADFIPNLTMIDGGASAMNQPSMRGLSAPVEASIVSSAMYVDGVPVLSGIGYDEGFYDVEHVEVLRGPQGTLYGKGAEAGVINVVTRQPDNEPQARITLDGGVLSSTESDSPFTKSATASVSGPLLEDTLYFALSGQYYQRAGTIENTVTENMVDDREHWSGRAQLRWTPNEDWDISFIAYGIEYNDGGVNMVLTEEAAAMYGLPVPGDHEVSHNIDEFNKSTTDTQALKIAYDITDALTLTSVTTKRKQQMDMLTDADDYSVTVAHSINKNMYESWAQELRLSYEDEGLKWLAGLYWDDSRFETRMETLSIYPAMAGPREQDVDGNTYAAFANVTYPLTEPLSLVAGLRYEVDKQEFTNHVADVNTDETWSAMTGKLTLEYRFTPDLMSYASVTTGYRSGGFNPMAADPTYYSYDEEKLTSYELGMKSTLLDKRLMLNGCLFYMDIADMQVTESLSIGESYLTNAGQARALGGEVETTAMLTRELTLLAGFGYTDISFTDFQDAVGDYDGNAPPYSTDYTFNLGLQYRGQSGFYARGDVVGYGKTYFDKANEYSRDPYELVNAKVGYETEQYDIYLYGKNIFDESYDMVGYYSGYYTVYSDPREIGMQITYRF